MRLLSILPIARSIRKEMLTYFSSEDIAPGTIVSIPIRSKYVPGIILESIDAKEAKAEIKDMPFSIKKIIWQKDSPKINISLINTVRIVAENNCVSPGSVLASIFSKVILENPEILKSETGKAGESKKPGFEILGIQSEESEKLDMMRSVIRESFAKKLSIAVIVPTEEDKMRIWTALSKGIESYSLIVNTDSKKQIESILKSQKDATHPHLFIGTAKIFSLLSQNIGTIILDNESSRFYKDRRSPFLHMRSFAEVFAREIGAKLIFADKLLSIESIEGIRSGRIAEYARISKRSRHKIQTLIADMSPKEEDEKKKEFKVFSDDLSQMIKYAQKEKKKIFIYSTRRGLAPQTVCRDCGASVLCDRCESPVVLHKKKEGNVFICHHCGKSKDAHLQCSDCGSWNLFAYGIGISKISEEVEKLIGDDFIEIDSDKIKKEKDAKAKIESFLKEKTVLIGTDIALKYLEEKSIDFSAIPSIESIASIPDFRTNERLMHTILDVKEKTKECMIVQTRKANAKIIEEALSGDLEGFANEELKARKKYGYPPFVKIIKLTISGKKSAISSIAKQISEDLREYDPIIFPAFLKNKKGESEIHIMIKIERSSWPDKNLSEILLSLPPFIKIDGSPQSLL